MAEIVFTNALVSINGTDLSAFVKDGTLTLSRVMLDDSVMGDTFKSNAAGLQQWTLTVTFVHGYGLNGPHQTLFPLDGAAAFNVTIQPVNGAASTTDPKFSGNAVLSDYNPISGKHGDLLTCQAKFASAGLLTAVTS